MLYRRDTFLSQNALSVQKIVNSVTWTAGPIHFESHYHATTVTGATLTELTNRNTGK